VICDRPNDRFFPKFAPLIRTSVIRLFGSSVYFLFSMAFPFRVSPDRHMPRSCNADRSSRCCQVANPASSIQHHTMYSSNNPVRVAVIRNFSTVAKNSFDPLNHGFRLVFDVPLIGSSSGSQAIAGIGMDGIGKFSE
jgi:hypothetical protein